MGCVSSTKRKDRKGKKKQQSSSSDASSTKDEGERHVEIEHDLHQISEGTAETPEDDQQQNHEDLLEDERASFMSDISIKDSSSFMRISEREDEEDQWLAVTPHEPDLTSSSSSSKTNTSHAPTPRGRAPSMGISSVAMSSNVRRSSQVAPLHPQMSKPVMDKQQSGISDEDAKSPRKRYQALVAAFEKQSIQNPRPTTYENPADTAECQAQSSASKLVQQMDSSYSHSHQGDSQLHHSSLSPQKASRRYSQLVSSRNKASLSKERQICPITVSSGPTSSPTNLRPKHVHHNNHHTHTSNSQVISSPFDRSRNKIEKSNDSPTYHEMGTLKRRGSRRQTVRNRRSTQTRRTVRPQTGNRSRTGSVLVRRAPASM